MTGAAGMLGRDLVPFLAARHDVIGVDMEVDVTDATAIGRHCVVESAEVEHSILLEGSSVRGLDGRMESSLLGRDVHIGRSTRQPRAYRFMVGDSSEIEIL